MFSSGEFAELVLRDSSGAKLETFKWSLTDKQLEQKIFSIIRNKYGIFQRPDKDLNWARDN